MTLNRRFARTALVCMAVLGMAVSLGACSSSSPAPSGDGGAGTTGASGTGGHAGTTGASGASGGAGTTGASGASGGSGTTGASGAGGGGGNAAGGQPLGSVCANTGNCSQADGVAVCCINMCVLQGQCSTGNQFLACASAADCSKYGGGKVCCQAGGGMGNFCTKPSGCSGTTLP
jgi:hypothetical protein